MKKLNKSELLRWLADNLDGWPTAVMYGPLVEGWTWHKDDAKNELKLHLDVKFEVPQTVSEREWAEELNKSVKQAELVRPVVEAMIDIETFDITHDAVTFQAAVVLFDEHHTITYREIWNLDVDEQLAAGREVSASTLAFHLGIPANAEAALQDPDKVTMAQFSDHIAALFESAKPRSVWSKGSFDFNILENLFASVGNEAPWKFYQVRELRTLMAECGVPKGDVSHNALEDCVAQVEQLARCRHIIEAGKKYFQLAAGDEKVLIEPISRHPSNTPTQEDYDEACDITNTQGLDS